MVSVRMERKSDGSVIIFSNNLVILFPLFIMAFLLNLYSRISRGEENCAIIEFYEKNIDNFL